MSKKIVLCLDGTWNGLAKPPTNVGILFDSLVGAETSRKTELGRVAEIEKVEGIAQVAKYIHGIGDEPTPLQYVEGAFGGGILKRIVQGYSYIADQYRQGDKIYICGFSRGATESRAIADLIASMGLLKRVDGEIDDAFLWRCELLFDKSLRKLPENGNKAYAPRFFQDFRFPERVIQDPESFENSPPKSRAILESYQFQEIPETLDPDVEIEAVAVWDTVEALSPLEKEQNRILNVLADDCHPKIKNGFHAISVDDNRREFAPSIWNFREGVQQCFFPGAHSDVGGGYPSYPSKGDRSNVGAGYPANETGLSNHALLWMLNKLPKDLFKDLDSMKTKFVGDSMAVGHLSDSHLFHLEPRKFPGIQSKIKVHQSVLDRWGQGTELKLDSGTLEHGVPYQPSNLSDYVVDGKKQPGVEIEPYVL